MMHRSGIDALIAAVCRQSVKLLRKMMKENPKEMKREVEATRIPLSDGSLISIT